MDPSGVDAALPRTRVRTRPSFVAAYIASWLEANAAFRRYVLRELRRRGPLRARDLEDRVADGWHAGGWNDDGRNVAMMLDILWNLGEVMIVGRDGQQRLWDLAARSLPPDEPRRSRSEIAREVLDRQLRARGVATPAQFGMLFDGRPDGWERALARLVREGVAVPVAIEGITKGEWYAHADLLDRPWKPRTVALSPFDDLVSDRDHTEALFDFHFRLEIYVPKAKRRWGYFVLPILHGIGSSAGSIPGTTGRHRSCICMRCMPNRVWTSATEPRRPARSVSSRPGWEPSRSG